MKVVVLFSGGKDSCFATWYVLHQGWEVVSLVTVVSENPSSFMFHTPNIGWTRLQAEAMGLPLYEVYTRGAKEGELSDLREGLSEVLARGGPEGVVSGAVQSEYQRTRIDRICESLGVKSFAPLWRKEPLQLLEEEVGLGFEFILSACTARGFTSEWLGRKIDKGSLNGLRELTARFNLNPAFEGGEAETFVTDSPLFDKRIQILEGDALWDLDRGVYVIKRAALSEKLFRS